MLRTRVISAIIGIILLIFLLLSPKYLFSIALFFVTIIGLNELFNAMKVSSSSFKLIGFLTAIPFMFFYNDANIFKFSLYLLIIGAFTLVVLEYSKRSVQDIYITVVGSLFVVFLISHILKVYDLYYGNLLIWLIFLSAWSTDTFAFFFGKKFGKHKITSISPNKTVEGSIAGLIASIIIITIYGYILQTYYNISFPIYHYIAMGTLCGILAQFGDLSASLLKRSANVKDFGNFMPGHGGFIDRFDSILFIAPTIYYYLYFVMKLS